MKIHLSISRRFYFLVPAALLLLGAFPAHATVNVIGSWRMGENDPGVTNGGPVISSVDNIASNNLVFATNSTYSSDVTPLAVTRVNSSLSVSLTNQSHALAASIVTNATDHFGIEAWVKPMLVNGTAQVIVYNGDTGTSGWGIFLDANNNYSGLFGGAAIITGIPAQQGVWTDVALVRNSPNTVLYINGVAVATNNISAPAIPVGNFGIGAPPQNPTGEFFTGLLDEVRVFAFAAGQFTTNDLLVNAGLPGARAGFASPLTATSSTLNGYVLPNGATTTGWFLWGTTSNYDHTNAPTTVPASNNSFPLSSIISKLGSGTTIHYALMVSNVLGTNISQDSLFTVGDFATTAITATGLPNIIDGSSAWGDYDNDGRLDLLLSGFTPTELITQIWHNNGDGTFSNINAGLHLVYNGSVAWGDYDNDGKLDVLISGAGVTEVWHNNGDGTFSQNTNVDLTPLTSSSVAWGDYDNDGRPDILIAGNSSVGELREPTLVTEVWRNNGDGTFSNIQAHITSIVSGSVAWGDFDNDGRLDILLTGNLVTQVWRNNGNGTFSNINAGLPGLRSSCAAWGDYDNDGYLDIVLSGTGGTGKITQVWHNNGNGTFSLNTNANLPGMLASSVAWGDYDNDGRLDILLSGDTVGNTTGYTAQLWHNNGDGTFSNLVGSFPNATASSVAFGDFDNDGRLDLILVGNYDGTHLTQLWKNQTLPANTPPQAPSGLFAETSGTNIVFHWNAAADVQTPTAGLTYNLRIGSSPGALNLVAPLSANNGFIKVPQFGNVQTSLSKSFVASLGTHYYWSVQAVDSAFAGSSFAPEQSFEILPVLAPVGAPNPVPGDTNGDGAVDGAEVITVLSHLVTNGTISPDALNLALRNYFAAYPLVMSNVDGLGGSNILFTLPNSPDPNLSVQSSTDLVNWQTLGPVNYGFIDTNAPPIPHRYYRLSYP